MLWLNLTICVYLSPVFKLVLLTHPMFSGSCSGLLPGEGTRYRLQRPARVLRASARVRLPSRLRRPHSSPSGAPLPSAPLPSTRLPRTRPTHRLPRKYSGTTRASSKINIQSIQELIKPQRKNDLKGRVMKNYDLLTGNYEQV